jgi:hypothetical protein
MVIRAEKGGGLCSVCSRCFSPVDSCLSSFFLQYLYRGFSSTLLFSEDAQSSVPAFYRQANEVRPVSYLLPKGKTPQMFLLFRRENATNANTNHHFAAKPVRRVFTQEDIMFGRVHRGTPFGHTNPSTGFGMHPVSGGLAFHHYNESQVFANSLSRQIAQNQKFSPLQRMPTEAPRPAPKLAPVAPRPVHEKQLVRPSPLEMKLKSQCCDSISCVRSHVYIIKQGRANLFKIGFSQTSVQARLKTLQTGNPKELTIVGMFHGAQPEEQELHRIYKERRQKGEWFAFPPGTCFLLP